MADSQEGGAEAAPSKGASATVAPGTPININLHASPAPEKPAKADRAPRNASEAAPTKDKSDTARAEQKGANKVLKSFGMKKGERREVLENLGSGKEDLAKEAVIKQLQASRKEAAVAKEEVAALKPLEERTKTLETRLKKVANAALEGLSDEAQKYVTKRAGDDPAAILDFIEDLRSSGMIKAASDAPAVSDAKKPSTTLASGTQPVAKPAGTLNHHETWMQLKAEGQTTLAANYYHLYGRKIDEQQPK